MFQGDPELDRELRAQNRGVPFRRRLLPAVVTFVILLTVVGVVWMTRT